MALQVSEGTAVRKLEAATQKLSKQEAHMLRLERKIDEKDQALYHAKMEARNKAKFLKRTIQDLRRQYSGALPLMKQVHVCCLLKLTKIVLCSRSIRIDLMLGDVHRFALMTYLTL